MERITAIEQPTNLFVRIGFMLMKKQLGKVITPAKVVYARYPQLMFLARRLYKIETSMKNIDDELKLLIQYLVATLNECSFCIDISRKRGIEKKLYLHKFNEILQHSTSPCFSDRERAALSYVTEMVTHTTVSDATFQRLKNFYSEGAIIEITFTAAAEYYLNLMTKPLGIDSDGLCMIQHATE